jgi:hypothetical protein
MAIFKRGQKAEGKFSKPAELNEVKGDYNGSAKGTELRKVWTDNDSAGIRGGRPGRDESGRYPQRKEHSYPLIRSGCFAARLVSAFRRSPTMRARSRSWDDSWINKLKPEECAAALESLASFGAMTAKEATTIHRWRGR